MIEELDGDRVSSTHRRPRRHPAPAPAAMHAVGDPGRRRRRTAKRGSRLQRPPTAPATACGAAAALQALERHARERRPRASVSKGGRAAARPDGAATVCCADGSRTTVGPSGAVGRRGSGRGRRPAASIGRGARPACRGPSAYRRAIGVARPGGFRELSPRRKDSGSACAAGCSASNPFSRNRRAASMSSTSATAARPDSGRGARRVGVVGLGYVGLPLAVEFARAGFATVRHRPRHAQGRRRQPRHVLHPRRRRPRRSRALVTAGRLRATTDFAVVAELDTINICVPTPLRKTKDPDMSYIVSAVEAIAAHLHPGMLVDPRVDHLSRHDRGTGPADARSRRPEGRASISSWPSRPSASIRATRSSTPTTCRKSSAASTPTATELAPARSTRTAIETVVPVSSTAGRRDGQAAREHVPRGQHRPRQRARADVRPARHRRVGSGRRRGDQAVRLHAVLSGSRPRRPLHSDRSVLSVVEGEAERLRAALHRARRPDQRVDAALRRRQDRRRAEPRTASRSTARRC